MFKRQLRPFYSAEDLAKVYDHRYNHKNWPDHIMRVEYTIDLCRWMRDKYGLTTAADLSCGDASIIHGIGDLSSVFTGDYTPGFHAQGPIEETIKYIEEVDLFILSETLEHVEDPQGLLIKIREKTQALVLTTPTGEDNDNNPEHYWGWDQEAVEEMLRKANFTPVITSLFDPGYGYVFQCYGAV